MSRQVILQAALLLLGVSVGHAALVQRHDVTSLTQVAQQVAVVEVKALTPRWVGGRIITGVEVVPHTTLKGVGSAAFTIDVPGGEIGGVGQKVAGAAAFRAGELALVFVQRRGDTARLVGMAQGKLRVDFSPAGIALVPDLRGLTTATRSTTGEWTVVPPALDRPIALGDLLVQIADAAKAQR